MVDQTQALHTLKSKGVSIRAADLAFLSPYATSKLKRFGDYPTDLKPEAMPTLTTLPYSHNSLTFQYLYMPTQRKTQICKSY